MPDYINRDDLLKAAWDKPTLSLSVYDIGNIKPVDGVEPVVHCKDCEYWQPSGSWAGTTLQYMEPIGGCEYANYYRGASDFCSKGKLKSESCKRGNQHEQSTEASRRNPEVHRIVD